MESNPLVHIIRGLAVFTSYPGSRRSRPLTWWLPKVEQLVGRSVTLAELRQAMASAGVVVTADGRTNLCGRASMERAEALGLKDGAQ